MKLWTNQTFAEFQLNKILEFYFGVQMPIRLQTHAWANVTEWPNWWWWCILHMAWRTILKSSKSTWLLFLQIRTYFALSLFSTSLLSRLLPFVILWNVSIAEGKNNWFNVMWDGVSTHKTAYKLIVLNAIQQKRIIRIVEWRYRFFFVARRLIYFEGGTLQYMSQTHNDHGS